MQARRGVALDVVAQLLFPGGELFPARLRRDGEIAHLAIAAQAIVHALAPQQIARPPGNCYST
jgi:hypothetical protein